MVLLKLLWLLCNVYEIPNTLHCLVWLVHQSKQYCEDCSLNSRITCVKICCAVCGWSLHTIQPSAQFGQVDRRPCRKMMAGRPLWLTVGPSQEGWQSCTECPSECRPLFTFEAHSEPKLRFNSANTPVVTSVLTEGGEPNKYKTCWRKGSVSVKHYWDGIHTLCNSSVYCVQFGGFQHI